MKKLAAKTIFIIGTTLFFSSCMMMNPGHMAGNHQMATGHDHSQGYYDPVCGNYIDTVQNELSWQYRGTIYYFHSTVCMDNFKDRPKRYISNNTVPASGNVLLWGIGGGAVMTALMLLMIL